MNKLRRENNTVRLVTEQEPTVNPAQTASDAMKASILGLLHEDYLRKSAEGMSDIEWLLQAVSAKPIMEGYWKHSVDRYIEMLRTQECDEKVTIDFLVRMAFRHGINLSVGKV